MLAGIRRALRGVIPETLSVRLAVTIALVSFATTAVAVGVDAWLATERTSRWAQDDLNATVESFQRFVDIERRRLREDMSRTVTAPRFERAIATRDFTVRDEGVAHTLVEHMDACSILVINADGDRLFTRGTASEIARLEWLASKMSHEDTSGLIAMDGEPDIVSGMSARDANGRILAYVIICRSLASESREWLDAINSNVRLTVCEAGCLPDEYDLDPLQSPVRSTPNAIHGTVALANLMGVDGRPAGVLRIEDPGAIGSRASSIVWMSASISGLAALLISGGLALFLSRMTRRPVARMVDEVKTQGYLAAEGVAYLTGDVAEDLDLPLEFRELGAVVEDLLRHLNMRQAELKEAVREAEYAEETLGIVVNESPEVKILLRDGICVMANPAAGIALGTPAGELAGMKAGDTIMGLKLHREDGTVLNANDLIAESLESPVAFSIRRHDHPERWYVAQSVRHADDISNRILLSARDITDERRLASIRAEILSIISHDIRSPLTVVIGYLDLLQRPMGETEQNRAIEAARRNAGRIADLLEDLLSATRAEELLAPAELQPVSLAELTEEVVASLGPTHPDQQLRLELITSPVVMGEERRLRQVLVNLTTNAYKYAGGSEPITVRVSDDGRDALVEIIDRGPGIPEDERQHIFDRFIRLENGSGKPGAGLGLYIVKTITHNHGGATRVEDTPGGGATFVVELPLAGDVDQG